MSKLPTDAELTHDLLRASPATVERSRRGPPLQFPLGRIEGNGAPARDSERSVIIFDAWGSFAAFDHLPDQANYHLIWIGLDLGRPE